MKFFSLEMSDMTARDLVNFSVGGYNYVTDTETGQSAWLINKEGLEAQNRNALKQFTQATIPNQI